MEYRITPLDEQSWRIEEYDEHNSAYFYLLTGTDRALLLDTGFGTVDVRGIVNSLTDLPLTVVNSHGHFDHIGANYQFETVWLHPSDEALYRLHRSRLPHPMTEQLRFLGEGDTFALGGRTLEVIEAPGHSLGSLCLLDVERRRLFTADTCCKADVLLCLEYCGTVSQYAATIRKLQGLRDRFDITWPSHHAVPVDNSILDQFAHAADLLLRGEDLGQPYPTPFGTFTRLAYGDIGIVYKDGVLDRK